MLGWGGNPVGKSEREPRLREFFSTASMLDDDDGGDDLADDVSMIRIVVRMIGTTNKKEKGWSFCPWYIQEQGRLLFCFARESQIKIKYSMHAGQRFRSLAQFSTLVHWKIQIWKEIENNSVFFD